MAAKVDPKKSNDLLNEIRRLNKKLNKIKKKAEYGLCVGPVEKSWALSQIIQIVKSG